MSCQEIREQLDDLIDGEATVGAARRIEAHLADCADCREELDGLRALRAATDELPAEVEPERDLWPGIESRIREPRRTLLRGPWSSASWVGLAAAAVLIAAVTIQLVRPGVEIEPQSIESATTMTEPLSEYALVSDEVRSRNGLMQVREDLLVSIAERHDSLDPETREMVARNLAVIDQAITEIQRALAEDPNNRGLEFLLAATYQREVEFLKQINML